MVTTILLQINSEPHKRTPRDDSGRQMITTVMGNDVAPNSSMGTPTNGFPCHKSNSMGPQREHILQHHGFENNTQTRYLPLVIKWNEGANTNQAAWMGCVLFVRSLGKYYPWVDKTMILERKKSSTGNPAIAVGWSVSANRICD